MPELRMTMTEWQLSLAIQRAFPDSPSDRSKMRMTLLRIMEVSRNHRPAGAEGSSQ